MKEMTLYTNEWSKEREDNARQSLYENCEGEWSSPNDIPDEEVWKEMDFLGEIDFEDFSCELEKCVNNTLNTMLLFGSVGTWRGRFAAGTIIDRYNDLVKAWKNCDNLTVTDKGGRLYINASHHDGTNTYELRELTDKGMDYLHRHECDMNEEELHRTLYSNSNYSRNFNYRKKAWN